MSFFLAISLSPIYLTSQFETPIPSLPRSLPTPPPLSKWDQKSTLTKDKWAYLINHNPPNHNHVSSPSMVWVHKTSSFTSWDTSIKRQFETTTPNGIKNQLWLKINEPIWLLITHQITIHMSFLSVTWVHRTSRFTSRDTGLGHRRRPCTKYVLTRNFTLLFWILNIDKSPA